MSEQNDAPKNFSSEAKAHIEKLETEIKQSKQEAREAYEKAKAEIDAKLQSEKDKIKEEARQELLQQLKDEKAKLDKITKEHDEILKKKIIAKILKFQPEANKKSLDTMTIGALKSYYLGVVKVSVSENLKRFKITCPHKKCRQFLGKTTTRQEAEKILKQHLEQEHGDKSGLITKMILISVLLSLLGVAAYSFKKQNRHIFKGDKS